MSRQSRESGELVTPPNNDNPLEKNGVRHNGAAPAPPRRRRRLPALLLPIVAAIVCGASAYFICANYVTPWYRSGTTLYFPPNGSPGNSNIITSLLGGGTVDSSGSVPVLGGIYNVPLVGSGPSTAIMALSSGRCQGLVASRLNLEQRWHMTPDKVSERLTKNVTYEIDKNGLLSVQALDTNAAMAEQLVHAYVNAMRDVSKDLTLAQSHKILVSLEGKLEQKQAALRSEQDDLVNLELRTTRDIPLGPDSASAFGDLDSQRRIAAIDLKTTQAEIDQSMKTAKEAQDVSLPAEMPYAQQARVRLRDLEAKLATAKSTLGPDNTQLQELEIQTKQAQSEYAAELKREITVVKKGVAPDIAALILKRASLQAKLDGINQAIKPLRSSVMSLPEAQMQDQRLKTDVARDENLVNMLATAVQQAQIAEQRNVPTFQTVDAPHVAKKPTLPRIGYTTALAAVAGFLLGLAWQVARVLLRQPTTQETMRRWADAYGLTEEDESYDRLSDDGSPESLPLPTAQRLSHDPVAQRDESREKSEADSEERSPKEREANGGRRQ